ncbi:pyrroline-5-carboxylate reductase dimerization-domain-containing protein [Polychytrium aggregatum]|uniref:pyrroline-5-carboxylate reductase dimerization-domain-containing protein n=1 Tax=Polychytrium aggregatum TaxID=110093 RepID=UPI0022FE4C90|nr:pyrroline-5-carboxylate reductase dimerization-domain-containing protein [Polychytrium aggregatum]KAI9206602.1 pyrroline-5-carboxylate reductase dimerization-domain-containing protein [Polychytrium aggregatum]
MTLDVSKRIAFIGGGNMASAIIGGLIAAGYPASNVSVSEPYEELRKKLSATYGVFTTSNNSEAIAHGPADIVILAVKPQVMRGVAEGISEAVKTHSPVVLSIAAGILAKDLERWLMAHSAGKVPSIIRSMPNTPALVSQGATAAWASETVSQSQKDLAFGILAAVSKKTYFVEREELLDVVTGLSGSGPAYFFLLIECIEQAAIKLGLPADVARGLAAQTCLGAGTMAVATGEDPADLRRKVTSPNGTTQAGIESAEAAGVRQLWENVVIAATKRSEELGAILGKDN